MPETDLILMSACIFLPTLFALVLLFIPSRYVEYMRWWTLLGTAATMVVSILLLIHFLQLMDQNPAGSRISTSLLERARTADLRAAANDANPPKADDLLARRPWISRFNIDYYLGVDGISMALILLTTILFFLSMIASWGIEKHVKGYCALFLLLETGVIGTFLALDLFLFYIFWEVMLLPMYFLIGVWGGPRREYAAIKFFLYTLLGSVFILIAFLAFYFTDVRDFVPKEVASKRTTDFNNARPASKAANINVPFNTFDLPVLTEAGLAAYRWQHANQIEDPKAQKIEREIIVDSIKKRSEATGEDAEKNIAERLDSQSFFSNPAFQITMFLFLFVGFAIKVPVFPFHTWLPDAHVEAPTPISMILAGILLKLGGYGIIRIAYPICPWAAEYLALYLVIFAMINIVYGAFAAMAQTDFKKLVAYSSVSHMGYVLLGIAVWSVSSSQNWSFAFNGAFFQMIGHGVSSAGMFLCVGIIYDRAHHRNLDNFRGLLEPMPLYSGISFILFFAALGLPGLCGFVGEFFVILGTWNFAPGGNQLVGQSCAFLAALTVVITAAYILWTLQRVYMGTNPVYKEYPDIKLRELLAAIPLVIFAVLLGVYPSIILSWTQPHVTGIINTFTGAAK